MGYPKKTIVEMVKNMAKGSGSQSGAIPAGKAKPVARPTARSVPVRPAPKVTPKDRR